MISKHAIVDLADPPCYVESGTNVWAFTSIQRGARIGKGCTIGEAVHIGKNVIVGNGCKIQNGAQLFEGVTLEDDVFVGPHAVFTNVITPRAFKKAEGYEPTLIKRGVSIGANATIICGVTIGEYAMIGAGTVITRDVEPHALMIGVPARKSCFVCKCGQPLARISLYHVCTCKLKYRLMSDGRLAEDTAGAETA